MRLTPKNGLVGQPAEKELIDDDIFSTGGGMELEADENNKLLKLNGGANTGQTGFNGLLYGENPSRTLSIRNINTNVEDTELKLLFEVSFIFQLDFVPTLKAIYFTW